MFPKQNNIYNFFFQMSNSVLTVDNLSEMKMLTNEEVIIAEALSVLRPFILFPMLDVGSGNGRIASIAYPDDLVIHLDPLKWKDADFYIPSGHSRVQSDFFEFQVNPPSFPTLLFCHSLQYLDDRGIDKVINKIKDIDPLNIVLVINKNDDILGKILALFQEKGWKENGEKHFSEFPGENYEEVHRSSIRGDFRCGTIENTIKVIVGLLLDTPIHSEIQHQEIRQLLAKYDIYDQFTIDQWVILYQKKK